MCVRALAWTRSHARHIPRAGRCPAAALRCGTPATSSSSSQPPPPPPSPPLPRRRRPCSPRPRLRQHPGRRTCARRWRRPRRQTRAVRGRGRGDECACAGAGVTVAHVCTTHPVHLCQHVRLPVDLVVGHLAHAHDRLVAGNGLIPPAPGHGDGRGHRHHALVNVLLQRVHLWACGRVCGRVCVCVCVCVRARMPTLGTSCSPLITTLSASASTGVSISPHSCRRCKA